MRRHLHFMLLMFTFAANTQAQNTYNLVVKARDVPVYKEQQGALVPQGSLIIDERIRIIKQPIEVQKPGYVSDYYYRIVSSLTI